LHPSSRAMTCTQQNLPGKKGLLCPSLRKKTTPFEWLHTLHSSVAVDANSISQLPKT
jgi:hypothetical protein